MIRWLTGPTLGVPVIPECLIVEWAQDGVRVVFSYSRQGNGITIHLAAEKEAFHCLDEALNDFCEWLFWAYSWCEMIFGVIGRNSIKRLALRCGFTHLCERQGYEILMRART